MGLPQVSRLARAAGVLLHPTSLPGPHGIGDLGPAAFAWVDALAHAGQKWWQMLPLGPTGFGDSPYQSFSAFAGNPALVSPELLVREGLLQGADLAGGDWPEDRVVYERVIPFKESLLARAWDAFQAGAAAHLRGPFESFAAAEASWLDDFALFMVLKDSLGGAGWQNWPAELLRREPAALDRVRQQHRRPLDVCRFGQFLFFRQWAGLREHAQARGVRLLGDVPIFVAAYSADVWAHPELFLLGPELHPTEVAGVPPDYFSPTGQLWGNPLYDWDALARTRYAWWVARLRATLRLVDLVRLDHFRGFEACWHVPAGQPTAQVGRWAKSPGEDLLQTLQAALDGLPVVAEDLGLITPDVEALRDRFGLPGMRVLQFAFGGGADNPHLPHRYVRNTVVYTGTHDNNTTLGWYAAIPDGERSFFHRYVLPRDTSVALDLIRLAWSSVADLAVAPLQDVLGLGAEARMNQPGSPTGNWRWRVPAGMFARGSLDRLGEMSAIYGRA